MKLHKVDDLETSEKTGGIGANLGKHIVGLVTRLGLPCLKLYIEPRSAFRKLKVHHT